jgi:predicted amidophosphoribosyltransferase
MKEMTNMYQKKINVRGAYIISDVEKIKGKKIVVLDDLFDSGCTLNEITYILRKAGAEKVFTLAITKTIHQD